MIPQRNISLISNTLVTAGGRRIPEAVIERDYVLAWFLTGLAGRPLRDKLAFKGGTALRRCWFDDYRFSEDLDFTLIRPISLEDILKGLNEIFATVEADSGLRIAELRSELDAKLALRQRSVNGMEQAIAAKEDRLRRLWTNRLAHQMSQLPPYDDVFREILRVARAANLPGP